MKCIHHWLGAAVNSGPLQLTNRLKQNRKLAFSGSAFVFKLLRWTGLSESLYQGIVVVVVVVVAAIITPCWPAVSRRWELPRVQAGTGGGGGGRGGGHPDQDHRHHQVLLRRLRQHGLGLRGRHQGHEAGGESQVRTAHSLPGAGDNTPAKMWLKPTPGVFISGL